VGFIWGKGAAVDKASIFKRYGYGWVTLGFFLISIVGHWLFGWFAYVDEQLGHAQPVVMSTYLIEMGRDTLENWQSEFLQLIWQIGGLAMLLWVGSPQSKEGDDRMEAKIDAILQAVDPKNADKLIEEIDTEFAGRHTDPRHMRLTIGAG
jgi:hypothetical protein